MILSSQFRCVGGEQYISFVNRFLGYTNDYVSLKGMKYKVGIMDSMKDMMKKWNELWDSNHQMRLMAGYTHEWVSQYNPDKYDFEYEDGTNLRWNIKKADRAAILYDTQKRMCSVSIPSRDWKSNMLESSSEKTLPTTRKQAKLNFTRR